VRGACIDIGSNTTRLLVADCEDGHLRAVQQSRAFTGIGRAISSEGMISAPKVAEVGEVVAAQLEQPRSLGAEQISCVATASVRRAVNQEVLVRWIERRCPSLTVRVLSAEEEARLAFMGAARTLSDPPKGLLGLIDVGGGSSEIVVGDPLTGVSWWASLPIGSGELSAELVHSDPPSPAELAQVRARVQAALDGLQPPRPALAVAVGGSASSLLQMTGGVLDAEALARALQLVTARPAAAVAIDTGLDLERVQLLPAGLVILEEARQRFDQPLLVGSGGLREGVLLQAAAS
jgi:exopolyphosphatase/guanosine-5'-triphosphate,3'-diphosphate pyrophosphatase